MVFDKGCFNVQSVLSRLNTITNTHTARAYHPPTTTSTPTTLPLAPIHLNPTSHTMADPDREASRVWRAWRTTHEMVRDRVRHPHHPRPTHSH